MSTALLPDLHSQSPRNQLPVKQVGHRGVRRILSVAAYDAPASLIIDVYVGLAADQRGAHMSRLIDCFPQETSTKSIRAYLEETFRTLQRTVPDAASWTLRARATTLLAVPDGFKPVEELVTLHEDAGSGIELTWGAAFKVCLACPQAQAAIAHDRGDDNVGLHPSHNQVCDLDVTITGPAGMDLDLGLTDLFQLGEKFASGKVRERYKRRGEADCVTEVHHNAMFAEDALRGLADALRQQYADASEVRCEIVNYESIFEYPLHCVVTA
jgi:GTP cyclohydrolase FolE2